MLIRVNYGRRQRFRARTRDLTLQGRVSDAVMPLRRAAWQLNDAAPTTFYVEPIADPGIDWVTQYKDSPAELRCRDLGDFTIEIPIDHPALRTRDNRLNIDLTDAEGANIVESVQFDFDPTPVPLPLDLTDLSTVYDIQEIGQTVVGAFDVDRAQNVIRSRAPVYPDSLLVLGAPHADQEATYNVRFLDFRGVKWLGPSDFYVGFEDKSPPIGIKTGWSSAGMMALNPAGEARCFIAWGDHSETDREWVVVTDPPEPIRLAKDVLYAVRHQVTFRDGVNRCRFRIWPAAGAEPSTWLCTETDAAVDRALVHHCRASFGLFQHSGMPIEWSHIRVEAL